MAGLGTGLFYKAAGSFVQGDHPWGWPTATVTSAVAFAANAQLVINSKYKAKLPAAVFAITGLTGVYSAYKWTQYEPPQELVLKFKERKTT